jgi:hypothetical protein
MDLLVLVECPRLQRNVIIIFRLFYLGFDCVIYPVIFSFLVHGLYYVFFNDDLYHGHDPICDSTDRDTHDPFHAHVIVRVFLSPSPSVIFLVACSIHIYDRFIS